MVNCYGKDRLKRSIAIFSPTRLSINHSTKINVTDDPRDNNEAQDQLLDKIHMKSSQGEESLYFSRNVKEEILPK